MNDLPGILIVEDDLETQKFFKIFLKKNFTVDICDNSEDFYSLLYNNSYKVILMDISIKGEKDGLMLTKEVKANEKYNSIPILCLSAHAFKIHELKALEAGVDKFLVKPISNAKLLNILLELAGIPK